MATGHKLMKEITDQFLHCKICYEPYKDPKTLVCLHTFCLDCIQKHVDSDSSRSSRFLLYNRYVTCPLCRSKTEIPSGGVRRLPDNFLVSSLTDVLNRKRISKYPPCEICPRERPKGNNASHKCLDCAKLLCKCCVDLHMTTKVTQHHSLIDIEGEKDIECKTHPEEIVRYYCEPCEECVCVVCTFQEHRDHEICSFSDGFTKYRSGLDGLFSQCKERLNDVKERLAIMQKAESSLKETRENIRDLAISYIQQVRSAERQLMQRVEEEYGGNVEAFLKNKEWLQENYDNLQTTCDLAEIIMNDKGVEMLLIKKELQNKFSALLEPALPSVPDNFVQDLKFVPGNVTLGHIAKTQEEDADCDGGCVKRHINDEPDGTSLKKRPCYTRDTQTDTGETSVTSVEMSFSIPVPTSQNKTVLLNGFTADVFCNDGDFNGSVSKTDVSVNTMQSMADFSKSLSYLSEECLSPGVCVKCSAELKKDLISPTGSLPIIDGTAPTVQDIIITNCDENNRGRQRRRRSLIKSRRTQTDLSLSSDSIDDMLRVSSQESLNGSFRKFSNQNLTAVAECTITKSIGLDPIDFGYRYNTFSRNKGVNTTENVKIVAETRSVKTNTAQSSTRESSTMTAPDCRTTDTQTLDKTTVSKCIATDYAGQRNKRTSTPIIITMDSSTCMPLVTSESKVTWTDSVQTTERSVATEVSETKESSTEPMKPLVCDQGTDVKPEMRSAEVNTDPELQPAAAESAASKERKPKSKEKKEKLDKTTEKKKRDKERKGKKEKKKMVDSCTETDPVIRCDKDTGTVIVPLKDSWTCTLSPTLVNTGVTPARPATRDASITTNVVAFMDQGTHTEVVKVVDNTTETTVVTCDGETLTERTDCQDAQTSVDVFTENSDTSTDTCHVTEKACNTDAEWISENAREIRIFVCDLCEETKLLVDTATSPLQTSGHAAGDKNGEMVDCETQTMTIQFSDKEVECELEGTDGFKCVTLSEMATSTENLPYIGLLSDIECDELILVPEVAIDVIGSDYEYERIYKNSFPVQMSESCVQTDISAALLDIDLLFAMETEFGPELIRPSRNNLVTVGINTDQKLTFEKETCTTMFHVFSTGTNTLHIEKTDKSTCTGSNVRAIQEAFGQSPVPERSTKVTKPSRKDISVETDPTLMDERMIACINKLKTVSERLNSPTTKTPPETPWNKQDSVNTSADNILNDLEKQTEDERKRNVMDLVAKTQAMTKAKECKTEPVKRKAQPLTTLKGRYNDKQLEGHEIKTTQATAEASAKSDACSQSNTPKSRRNNSAPPRIATVPNQVAMLKSPKLNPKTIGQSQCPNPEHSTTLPSTSKQKKEEHGPELYSTVPKTRHPKLPMISESRPSSTGPGSSGVSFRSSATNQRPSSTSSDKTLDFSSLKISAPPRQSSVSPTPPRRTTQRDATRSARPAKKPTIEIIPAPDQQRTRTGSSSSDLTDNEPSQEKKGLMKKLFGSRKKKGVDKRNLSPSKSPKPGRKALATAPVPPPDGSPKTAPPMDKGVSPKEKPKEKPKPFVYMRSRIFSIEQKDEDKYDKPIVNKYCVEEEKPPVLDFAATFKKK